MGGDIGTCAKTVLIRPAPGQKKVVMPPSRENFRMSK
jgi:hypothetical protein